MEIFLLLLVLSFIMLLVFAIGSTRREPAQKIDTEIDGLDQVEIQPDWIRCSIRAEKEDGTEGDWVNVRLQFFTPGDEYVRLTGERCTQQELANFENRLLADGWTKHAEGSSEDAPEGFDRLERTVIYTRAEA